MKKTIEKVALVALICVALIFVISTILYMSNVIDQPQNWSDNGVVNAIMFVFAVAFVGLACYLIYVNFAENENIKRMLLYCDCQSQTTVNSSVVRNIVKGCTKDIDGLKIKKIKIRQDAKQGFVLKVFVVTDAQRVQENVDTLRYLLIDSFSNTLGFAFNSLDFVITKLSTRYKPNKKLAQEQAETLQQVRDLTQENFVDPPTQTNESDTTNETNQE